MSPNCVKRHILLDLCVCLLFHLVQLCWEGLTALKWYLCGTHLAQHTTSSKQAQVLNIWYKYNFDPILLNSSTKYFLLTHMCFEVALYVLKDEISLYCINEREAVFLEAPPGVEVWKSKYGAFHKQAQFENAVRLVKLPIQVFHDLASEIGSPKEKLVFLEFNVRSGSTLVSQMFESTEKCVVFSEPNILMKHDMNMVQEPKKEQVKKNLLSGIRMLCKPRQHKNNVAYVFKMTPMTSWIVTFLKEQFPESAFLFTYRNPQQSILSMIRVAGHLKLFFLYIFITGLSQNIGQAISIRFLIQRGAIQLEEKVEEVLKKTTDPMFVASYFYWASKIFYFLEGKNNIDIKAIKYEHLVANPVECIQVILKHCGLSQTLVQQATKALDRDSQANSVISQQKQAIITLKEPTEQGLKDIQLLAKCFRLPGYHDNCVLPNTITNDVIQ